ncbi:nucleotidyltransferase [Clostridium malenominatum]|uniref:tRNA(Met) cytidine acetate ligase n=1 Tax=Clostridium malenominatum TaxID=1539 RepID=A0ABP3U4C3_9CLOT
MNITGIVAEYNPLHKGHVYHIKKTRELTSADGIVAVMSGNFVQRGIPAMLDKWTRAKMALENGVDLVIELPLLYSISSAEFFSFGAISLFDSLGIINNLSFGSESGNISSILDISKVLLEEPITFKGYLKEYLKEGLPFHLARAKALSLYLEEKDKDCFEINNFLSTSNNILAIEYCKNLLRINSTIIPFTIKREGNNYNSLEMTNSFSSASSIRNFIKNNEILDKLNNQVPLNVFNSIVNFKEKGYSFPLENEMLPFIKHKYFNGENGIENLPDVSEGLHNRIYDALNKYNTLQDVIQGIKTKRYTYTRISRILCQYFIGFDTIDTFSLRKESCPYARVLGFNKRGSEILKVLKKKSSIPVYTKIPKEINPTLYLDIKGTKCYSLLNKSCDPLGDFKNKPVII